MRALRMRASCALALALVFGGAFAQENRVDFSAAVIGQIPVGDFADISGRGFGGLGILEGGTFPGWAFSVRSGFMRYSEKAEVTRSHIPLLGGIKYTFPGGGLYLAGEGGAVFTQLETSGSPSGEKSETNPGWGIAIGTMPGILDLRVAWNVWDAANMSESMALGLVWGVRIQSF